MPMTWTSLRADKNTDGSIRQAVNHATIPADTIIQESEALILQRLRVIEMKFLLSGVLNQGDSEIDIALIRFLSPLSFRFYGNRSHSVTHRLQEMFELAQSWDSQTPPVLQEGTPTDYMHDRNTIYLNVRADETMYYRIWLYQAPEPLSGTNEENLITQKYPHIMRAATNAKAYSFRKDERREAKELEKLAAYIDEANIESDMAKETAEYNLYALQDGANDFGVGW